MDPPFIEVQSLSTDGENIAVIEDDGRVAYAYLYDLDEKICADVWLYNRVPAPQRPEWPDREAAPYANPAAFVDPAAELRLPISADDISVEWRKAEGIFEAWIFIHQRPVAKLVAGAKPGWSALVARDGPLAKVWQKS
jgi:hypothetical protein